MTTLKELPGGELSLIKIGTILRSVCLIETPTGCLGTGFLVKIPAEVLGLDGKDRLAFMSAGHNFQASWKKLPDQMVDFSKYKLHFGYTGGSFGEVHNGLDCALSEFGELTGSIGLGGKRRYLPGYIESDSRPEEDYCMLLLPESPANRGCKADLDKLEFLPCGSGEYLRKKTEDSLLGSYGHPVAGEVPPPLRVSFGAEKYVGNTDPEHHIFYDVDTLGGSSGSPVFERSSDGCGYAVKAIHIREVCR